MSEQIDYDEIYKKVDNRCIACDKEFRRWARRFRVQSNPSVAFCGDCLRDFPFLEERVLLEDRNVSFSSVAVGVSKEKQ